MEITGYVVHAMEMRSGVSARTGNPWASRDYVLEIPNGQFSPRHFVFTVFGEERIKQFALRKNEEVTIKFDVDANEYQGKWYNRITAYDVVRSGATASPQPAAQPTSPASATPQQTVAPTPQPTQAQGDDDLPF